MSAPPIPLREFRRQSASADDEESLLPRMTMPDGSTWFWGGVALALLLLAVLGTVLGLSVATFLNSEKIHGPGHYETCSIERSVDGSLDDRCPPCEQANEQQKLNEFVRWQIDVQNEYFGTYAWTSGGTLTDVGAANNQDPLFPETFDKIQKKIYDKAAHIDMDLLDPYDVINFNETFMRKGFYQYAQNRSAEVEICERRLEDWQLSTAAIAPAVYMFGNLDATTPVTPVSLGAWVLDSELFAYYVGQMEGAIPAIRARIDSDWWTAVYDRIQSNAGVLRAGWVAQHASQIALDISWTDPNAMPQPIKLYLAQRGFVMSPAEEVHLDSVLAQYHFVQTEFYNYTLTVTSPLVDPISENDWFLQYGWTDCFGYTNGLWYYNMDVDDLEAYYQDTKARAENIATQMLVQRDALWPADAWLPWQFTYLHYAFPEGSPNPFNITGWAVPPEQCDTDPATGAPFFGNTVAYNSYRYYNQRYELYNAVNGQTGPFDVTFAFGECNPFAGNGYTVVPGAPRNEKWVTPVVFGAQGPEYTLNLSYAILIHEMKHAAQFGMIMGTACPTCYSVFQTVRSVQAGFPSLAAVYAVPGSEWNTYVEGSATDAVEQSLLLGMQNEYESFHASLFEQGATLIRTVATLGIRLGHWDLAGAMAWIAEFSWVPPAYSSASIYQQSIRDMTPTPGRYALGAWKVRVARQRAQERCGSGFNEQDFNTLTHALPPSTISAWDQLLEDYITAGCVSPTTRFGDARRTVVAPSLQ